MDYGFAFLSATDIHKDVALAERKGFTHAWLYDTQMICADVFQCLALCAIKTKKIKLGTNVTNPLSRIAPVTANNFATLNLLAPGRAIKGIGTGNTARRTLGMPAAKLSELREHVEICRGLLAGQTRALRGERPATDDSIPQSDWRMDQPEEKSAHLCRRQWTQDAGVGR